MFNRDKGRLRTDVLLGARVVSLLSPLAEPSLWKDDEARKPAAELAPTTCKCCCRLLLRLLLRP